MLCTKTVFAFGSQSTGLFTHLVLRPKGRIHGYLVSNPKDKERAVRWEVDGDVLTLFTASGGRKSTLKYSPSAQGWLGFEHGSLTPHYLLPVVSAENAEPSTEDAPNIIVNSIPKSGTYFMSLALHRAGCTRSGIHATDFRLFDFTGRAFQRSPSELWRSSIPIADNDVFKYELEVTPYVAAGVLQGNHMVGHFREADTLRALDGSGIMTVHLVRNLRAVLRSLFQFKKDRIAPLSPADAVWRKLPENALFGAFLSHFYDDKDIVNIIQIARALKTRQSPVIIRYEDLYKGDIKPLLDAVPTKSFA